MISFKGFIKENMAPFASAGRDSISIEEDDVRDHINVALSRATNGKFLTPYIALQNVEKVLAANHIFLPKHPSLEGESGSAVFDINQFGEKTGENDQGEVVTATQSKFSVYFEYRTSICGMYIIFCEILNEDELDQVLEDLEAELNYDEDTEEELDEACWTGYKKVGMKKKGDRIVPDCVVAEEETEVSESSNEKLQKYVARAVPAHGDYNFMRRVERDPVIKKKYMRKEKNRREGISKAIDKIDGKRVDEAESKDVNKAKKKIVMIRQANAKPEAMNDGRAIARIRKSLNRPTVNNFDIRNLKIAEESETNEN